MTIRLAKDTHSTLGSLRPRLLFVEDEPLIRIDNANELASRGFEVIQAATVAEAVAKFNRLHGRLAAAIVDIGLPGGSGETLIAHLRAHDPNLPIIIATGYPLDQVHRRVGKLTRMRVVEKPYMGGALL